VTKSGQFQVLMCTCTSTKNRSAVRLAYFHTALFSFQFDCTKKPLALRLSQMSRCKITVNQLILPLQKYSEIERPYVGATPHVTKGFRGAMPQWRRRLC